MNKLIYSSKDLFTVTGNNTLILSTVSLQPLKDTSIELSRIKMLYRPVYQDYALTTEVYRKKKILTSLLGRSYWFGFDNCKQRVAFIYVSKKTGRWQCPLVSIRKRTIQGLDQLLQNLSCSIEVHCNKLNVLNFGVPWTDMVTDLNKLLEKYPKHRIVIHQTPV